MSVYRTVICYMKHHALPPLSNRSQLAKKYGDVYSMRMGQAWMVVINGFGAVKEALVHQKDSLVDRPPFPLVLSLTNGRGEKT